jgi:methyl-accepting chemotaxis protein
MLLNNLKIYWKLVIGFAFVIIVTSASMAAVYIKLAQLNDARGWNQHTQIVRLEIANSKEGMLTSQTIISGLLLKTDPSLSQASLNDSYKKTYESLARVASLVADDPSQVQRVHKAEALMHEWEDFVAKYIILHGVVVDLPQRPSTTAMVDAKAVLTEMDAAENALWVTRSATEESETTSARLFLIGGSLVAAVTAAMACWLLTRAIAQPVSAITTVMKRLEKGDETVAVPSIGRRDEVGEMAAAVQSFKDAASAKRQAEAEASQQRQAARAERAEAEQEREAAAGRQAQVVEALANGLAELAEGNLTFALNTVFAPEYERLRSDFNAAVDGLHKSVREINVHSDAIGSGTSEIAHATDDLAKRTEQQAASLEQTAAALDQITATVRQTATGSERAQTLAATAKSDAEASGKVVGEAISAMGEIEGSAQKIGQIIGVIDEIAFQTNLLALNAGVEAARAGEAGRGFAVVASEVRALAQRAADAAKEIKSLITMSRRHVERGVHLVGDTGRALNRIQGSVTEINAAISEIAASAQEQASGLAEVNSAINQMDQVTQQNAAMVEESTAAAHSLSKETEALTQAVARFRIEVRADVRRPTAAKPTRAVPKVAVQGNTVRKIVEAPETENWDSF